jgi:hypothetical protein
MVNLAGRCSPRATNFKRARLLWWTREELPQHVDWPAHLGQRIEHLVCA